MSADKKEPQFYTCVEVDNNWTLRWHRTGRIDREISELVGSSNDWFCDRGNKFWFRHKEQATLFKLKYGN